jgi:hypothetical protein
MVLTTNSAKFLTKTYQEAVQTAEINDQQRIKTHRIPITPIDTQNQKGRKGFIWLE